MGWLTHGVRCWVSSQLVLRHANKYMYVLWVCECKNKWVSCMLIGGFYKSLYV